MHISVRDKYLLLRRRKRITLKEVAEYIGVSESMVGQYERSTKNFSLENERKYKKYIRMK